MDKMSGDENIDNIAQTFFLLMILCSVISDSHFVIHERSPRIQYLFDSLQALFIFGFTQKQQERIIWETPVEGGLTRVDTDSCKETPVEGGLSRVDTDSCKETPVEGGLTRVDTDSCKETPVEGGLSQVDTDSCKETPVKVGKSSRVSFQTSTHSDSKKKKKLLEDRPKVSTTPLSSKKKSKLKGI